MYKLLRGLRQLVYSFFDDNRLIMKISIYLTKELCNPMNELLQLVMEKTGLSEDIAKTVIEIVVNFIKDKMPGPIASQLDGLLQGGEMPDMTDMLSQGSGGIGGFLSGLFGGGN